MVSVLICSYILHGELIETISEIEPLQEWEYLPPVGPRAKGGFSGLKNAGATCYMNSVLQQLFMVPSIRLGILGAAGACTDPNEDFSGELDNRVSFIFETISIPRTLSNSYLSGCQRFTKRRRQQPTKLSHRDTEARSSDFRSSRPQRSSVLHTARTLGPFQVSCLISLRFPIFKNRFL